MTKLIQINVPSSNSRKSSAFYQVLFPGLPFAASLTGQMQSLHKPISADGIQLTISPRQVAQEQITCYLAVDDLNSTLTALEQLGGVVVVEPFTLAVAPEVFANYEAQVKKNFKPDPASPSGLTVYSDIGTSAIVQDPDGNLLGLTQLRPQAYSLFNYGSANPPLTPDQIAQHQRGVELGNQLKPIS